MFAHTCTCMEDTIDREIFTLKIFRIKIFRVDKFSRFIRSEIFLTVDGYIMDKRPGRSLHLSREPAITGSNTVADRSSCRSIGRLPQEVWTCAHTYSLNITAEMFLFTC